MREVLGRLFSALFAALIGGPSTPVDVSVIGAGLARTGTSSLKAALEILLKKPVHHMEDVVADAEQQVGWTALADGHKDDALLKSLVRGRGATVDTPSSLHVPALMRVFPKAKVILTTHPKGREAWYKSTIATVYHIHYNVLNVTWLGSFGYPFRAFHVACRHLYLDNEKAFLTRDQWLQPKVAMKKYDQHNGFIKRYVPRHKLLVYSVDQGWEPLCKFLKLPVPEGIPFPKMNDTNKLRAAASVLYVLSFVLPVVFTAGLAWAVQKLERRLLLRKGVREQVISPRDI